METLHLTRQMDILPTSALSLDIGIIGAGAIGSQVAMCLAKMGFESIDVYDFDIVDDENMNCQWYGPHQIGKNKVTALFDNINNLTGTKINPVPTRVRGTLDIVRTDEIMICAVDSMKVRSELWKVFADSGIRWWIDPRMGAEEGMVYTVDVRDDESRSRYEKTLYSDDEAVQEACTAKATMYCAMMLSGQVSKIVKDIAMEDNISHTIQWNVRQDAYLSFGR